MEFPNKASDTVEIHVKMSRDELADLLHDMNHDITAEDPYQATEDFMDYLKGL
jgi:hypothetical protein